MELEPPPYDSIRDSVRVNDTLSGEDPKTGIDTPAAPVFSSQPEQQSNVVILNQPTTAQTTEVAIQSPPRDYLVLTVVMVLLCVLCFNLLAYCCLFPAVYFSYSASRYKKAGDYNRAKDSGKTALWCNIAAIIYIILFVVISGVILGVLFGAGAVGVAPPIPG